MKVLRNGKLVTVKALKSDVKAQNVETKNIAPEAPVAPIGSPADESTSEDKRTVKELKAFLDNANVEYPKKAKRDDLVDLAATIEENDSVEDAI